MKNLLYILFAAVILTTVPSGCKAPTVANAQVSSDIVVNAERLEATAKDTIDVFLHLEYNERDLVKAKLPQVHVFAESLRRNAPRLLLNLDTVKNAYKHNRSPENETSLATVMATVNSMVTQARQYSTQLSNLTP